MAADDAIDRASPLSGSTTAPQAIILAAGKGTRMGGDLPKVAYEVAGRPMVWWVVRACLEAGVSRCLIVVGYHAQQVKDALTDYHDSCAFVRQDEQLGTGHATQMAGPLFDGQPPADVFVLPGDGPLIKPQTLSKLLDTHRSAAAAATLVTSVLDDPTGYGRVIRDNTNAFQAIIEQKDATPQQKQVREINTGYYCFQSNHLFESLANITNTNNQGEFYLTDVPGILKQAGRTVAIVGNAPPQEVMGVNTPQQLDEVDRIMRASQAQPSANRKTKESA